MPGDPTEIPLRLTKRQMNALWSGLDFLFACNAAKAVGQSVSTSYWFNIHPLPQGTDTGRFSSTIAARIDALRNRLQPKQEEGGRMAMNSVDVRVAILSTRLRFRLWRKERKFRDDWREETRRRFGLGKARGVKLQIETREVVASLSKYMKRADRRFVKVRSQAALDAQLTEWKSHLLWMIFRYLWFREIPRSGVNGQSISAWEITGLRNTAEEALSKFGYQSVEKKTLNRAVRKYRRRCREGREPFYPLPVMINAHGLRELAHMVDFLKTQISPMRRQAWQEKDT